MKHGIRIPTADRDVMAIEARQIALAASSRAVGIAAVEDRFDIATPTARNLISRGNYLAAQIKGAAQ